MMRLIIVLGTVLLCWIPLTSDAVVKGVTANIERTLVTGDGKWGGCMVKTQVNFQQLGLNCPAGWVTFSCTGDFTSKDVAYRMFDSALLAFALGNPVFMAVDDSKKHNGFCYVGRIDVLQ